MARNFLTKILANAGIQIPTGAGAGLFLQSDASGNGSWAAPTVAAAGALKPAVSDYIAPVGTIGTGAPAVNAEVLTPVYLWAGTISQLAVEVTTAGAAGSLIRLGIRNGGTPSSRPGTLLIDAGTVAATTTGTKTITISQAIATTGWYWVSYTAQTAAPTVRTVLPQGDIVVPGPTFAAGLGVPSGWQNSASVSGALPSAAPSVAATAVVPRVGALYSAVT